MRKSLLLALPLVLMACSAPASEAHGSSSDAIVGGAETYDDPEVGLLAMSHSCTGTLIQRNVVITAAHCVGYGSSVNASLARDGQTPTFGTFTVSRDAQTRVSYLVDAYVSLGSEVGDDDIALVHLQSDVDADFVTHIGGYDEESIGNGTPLAQYGYGCTSRATGDGALVKRRVSYVFGDQTQVGCPVDSGGPVFTGAHNVVLIASGYWADTGADIFASALAAHGWIQDRIAAWEQVGASTASSKFCPKDYVSRRDMARYLERLKHRGEPGWSPPAPSDARRPFDDLPKSSSDAGWIYQLADDQITRGCNPDGTAFCPDAFVPREQMAAFLIRLEYNDLVKQGREGDIPIADPADLTRFVDVNVDADRRQFARSIARLYEDQITHGRDATHFDPLALVRREEMAAFLMRFEHGDQRASGPAPQHKFADITDPGTQHDFEGYIDEVTGEGIMEPCR